MNRYKNPSWPPFRNLPLSRSQYSARYRAAWEARRAAIRAARGTSPTPKVAVEAAVKS